MERQRAGHEAFRFHRNLEASASGNNEDRLLFFVCRDVEKFLTARARIPVLRLPVRRRPETRRMRRSDSLWIKAYPPRGIGQGRSSGRLANSHVPLTF